MKLSFITGNQGKFIEVKEKMCKLNIELIQENIGYPEIQANTLEDVAVYGVSDIRQRFQNPFIIEDAGIFINTLNGFPGVYSKYVHSTIGCKGVLNLMEDKKDRCAIFRSVYGYSEPEEDPIFFVGECKGKISRDERGKGGFGYDPIFIPETKTMTFAEMNITQKNKLSHRGIALDNLLKFLIEVKGV